MDTAPPHPHTPLANPHIYQGVKEKSPIAMGWGTDRF